MSTPTYSEQFSKLYSALSNKDKKEIAEIQKNVSPTIAILLLGCRHYHKSETIDLNIVQELINNKKLNLNEPFPIYFPPSLSGPFLNETVTPFANLIQAAAYSGKNLRPILQYCLKLEANITLASKLLESASKAEKREEMADPLMEMESGMPVEIPETVLLYPITQIREIIHSLKRQTLEKKQVVPKLQ